MQITNEDLKYLKLALSLAEKGRLSCAPNPMVGAVIVQNKQIVGKGFHKEAGRPHAEIEAISDALNANANLVNSTIYVTLEPCSTHGKTPPCTTAIIDAGIAKVVVGATDPNPLHAGQGFEILRQKGIEVIEANLPECTQINEKFNCFIQNKKPFVHAKWAMSLDGKIACFTGDSRWISNAKSRAFVHQLRAEYDAIMVGSGTVLIDNPHLNVRLTENHRQPIKIVVDSLCSIPLDSLLLKEGSTIIACTQNADENKVEALENLGVKVFKTDSVQVDLNKLMEFLATQSISSVLVEGGNTLLASLFEAKLIDRVTTFIAPKIIGGKTAKSPVGGQGAAKMADVTVLEKITTKTFDHDIMISGLVNKN